MVSIRKCDTVICNKFPEVDQSPLVVNGTEGLTWLISVYLETSSQASVHHSYIPVLPIFFNLGAFEITGNSPWNAFPPFLPLFLSLGFLF